MAFVVNYYVMDCLQCTCIPYSAVQCTRTFICWFSLAVRVSVVIMAFTVKCNGTVHVYTCSTVHTFSTYM